MNQTGHFLLLTAPPASGKTFWINNFAHKQPESKILVISPLRVLADECRASWGDRILVETPESWLKSKTKSSIVIFDEFHLLFHWGESFRPVMWEVFFELSVNCDLFIGLTATMSEQMKLQLENFTTQFDQVLWCDLGNHHLKNLPAKYFKLPTLRMMENLLQIQPAARDGVTLVFCQYRQDVLLKARMLQERGFLVWTCVGGESQHFSQRLKQERPPHFIVATTVLSHGVNLPRIVTIFFLYKVNCPDFWVQMVARGGRRGEKYQVYSLENPSGISWNKFTNFLAILHLSLRMKAYHFIQQFTQWFLKE